MYNNIIQIYDPTEANDDDRPEGDPLRLVIAAGAAHIGTRCIHTFAESLPCWMNFEYISLG